MIDRRHALVLLVAAATTAWLPASPTYAQGFQRFVPFLIELDGWRADKPDGVSMQMPGHAMDTATRKYARGDATLDAQIIVGPAAQGLLAPMRAGIKVETPEGRMNTSTVDGLVMMRTYTVKDRSGAIVVALADNAVFSLSFHGIADEEALTLARKFNWKAMQGAVK
ncbi:MAG: hypothetical protein HY244_01575 [Rhizobiales bacterium]|nr:hypothetical protein [Hyphomicrobiales bacterium]